LVPATFYFGLSTKDHTLLLLKLLSSSYMATTQSGSHSASSTLKGSNEETNELYSQKVATRDRVVSPVTSRITEILIKVINK
jgi:hypothetical protein